MEAEVLPEIARDAFGSLDDMTLNSEEMQFLVDECIFDLLRSAAIFDGRSIANTYRPAARNRDHERVSVFTHYDYVQTRNFAVGGC